MSLDRRPSGRTTGDDASPVVGMSAAGLAGHVADLATARRERVGAAGGHAVRVAVDAPVPADAAGLADLVAAALTDRAVPAGRVRTQDWLRARSLRLEHGADADAYYDGWLDQYALRREVLDPLGPDGHGQWLPRLRDPATDRSYRDPRQDAVPGLVVVVDGSFLARWELADAFDLVVHLQTSQAAQGRRLDEALRPLVVPAWRRYLEETWPADRADVLVRYEHPTRPALVRRG